MANVCPFSHERPICDILRDRKLSEKMALTMGLSALSCALVTKLFKSHVTTNALIAMSIGPSFRLMCIINHRITQGCMKSSIIYGIGVLTILPQLALIKFASLRGYHISYLWAPTNCFTTVLAGKASEYFFNDNPSS